MRQEKVHIPSAAQALAYQRRRNVEHRSVDGSDSVRKLIGHRESRPGIDNQPVIGQNCFPIAPFMKNCQIIAAYDRYEITIGILFVQRS